MNAWSSVYRIAIAAGRFQSLPATQRYGCGVLFGFAGSLQHRARGPEGAAGFTAGGGEIILNVTLTAVGATKLLGDLSLTVEAGGVAISTPA